MAEETLKSQITSAMKEAMKAKDKNRLGTIRLILADIKKVEVDERIDVDDTRVLAILDKMVKQRRDSVKQYTDAGRDDLAQVEANEIEVIQAFLPKALTDEEISELITSAIAESGAASMQDMGKVMNLLKPKLQGRADVGSVSQKVKAALAQ
ncbi:transamidase GatB domain protein [Oleiphilus messinensis]|uniref:Transamidase GatB domain protein n=1 Tax=Oleiphilus messinensis TaxID=141451 RepID=A0A1Y0IDJ8_9GAMM|nr:GatB/YqeY domain-containing protein [Oleiphilus messinensis]ARU58607.1 transamidase GatB domain protein [Oleiphilus messinensis]